MTVVFLLTTFLNRNLLKKQHYLFPSKNFGEAPWSSGERQGLTVLAMVFGREFNSQVCLKTRWIRWTT
jgi:hypothetical protein